MFKQKEEVVVIAVLAIITSALLSSYGVYYFFVLRSPTPNQTIPPETTTGPEVSPKKHLETTDYDGESENQKVAKLVGDFYNYLGNGEYNLAVPLFNWQCPGLEKEINEIIGTNYSFENKTEILEKICSQEDVKTKIEIVTVEEKSNGQGYNVTVNYLDKNNQVYVNSARVAGQFINETDFVIDVIKTDNNFLVNTLPGILVTVAE